MLWAVEARPLSVNAPQVVNDGDSSLPILAMDDATGDWFLGGANKTQTWTPGGGSSLQIVQLSPSGQALTLPFQPKLLLLFNSAGQLLRAGAGNDFTLNGVTATLNFMPGPGAQFQAVVG